MSAFRIFLGFFIVLFQSFSVVWAEEGFPKPDTTIMLPMRDGTKLPTDLYLPAADDEKFPCLLIRSPTGRNTSSIQASISLAKFGYAIAVQETRSSLDRDGKTLPYYSDGWGEEKDGYDTVEWLANSQFTNGKIGTIGNSALGITQLMLAPSAPPSLKAQYIVVAPASLYHHAIYPGGQVCKNQVEGWLGLHAKDPSVMSFLRNQPTYNSFWMNFDTVPVASSIKVPAIIMGGWYDTFIQGTIDSFLARQNHGGVGAKGRQKLIIGPWFHMWPSTMKLGDFEVPLAGRTPPVDISPKRWFDFYLKGVQNGTDDIPAVMYYVMGPFDGTSSSGNVWRQTDVWPVPAKLTSYYLAASQKLTTEWIGLDKAHTFDYAYNASDPVPTIGGSNLFLESGPKDQSSIEKRADVLVFTSEPLKHDLEVTGKLLAKLYVSSDLSQVDVAVRLTDVYPDGRSILLTDGLRHSSIEANAKPQEIEVDLLSTSVVFAKGHCIRISVSASNYPRFDKPEVADGKIIKCQLHTGGACRSQLLLPVVKNKF